MFVLCFIQFSVVSFFSFHCLWHCSARRGLSGVFLRLMLEGTHSMYDVFSLRYLVALRGAKINGKHDLLIQGRMQIFENIVF